MEEVVLVQLLRIIKHYFFFFFLPDKCCLICNIVKRAGFPSSQHLLIPVQATFLFNTLAVELEKPLNRIIKLLEMLLWSSIL